MSEETSAVIDRILVIVRCASAPDCTDGETKMWSSDTVQALKRHMNELFGTNDDARELLRALSFILSYMSAPQSHETCMGRTSGDMGSMAQRGAMTGDGDVDATTTTTTTGMERTLNVIASSIAHGIIVSPARKIRALLDGGLLNVVAVLLLKVLSPTVVEVCLRSLNTLPVKRRHLCVPCRMDSPHHLWQMRFHCTNPDELQRISQELQSQNVRDVYARDSLLVQALVMLRLRLLLVADQKALCALSKRVLQSALVHAKR